MGLPATRGSRLATRGSGLRIQFSRLGARGSGLTARVRVSARDPAGTLVEQPLGLEDCLMATAAQGIQWRHDFDQARTESHGKLILLDFSAAPM